MNQDISKMVIISVIVEGIITYFNEFFISGAIPWQMIASLLLGVIVSISYKFDLLKHLDLESDIPYIGSILTGILFSRGSNYMHDILKTLNIM